MSVQVEKLEHNMAKLTIEVEASKFDAAMKKAYNKFVSCIFVENSCAIFFLNDIHRYFSFTETWQIKRAFLLIISLLHYCKRCRLHWRRNGS